MARDPFRTTYIRNGFLRALWYPLENIAPLMKLWRVVLCSFFIALCVVEVALHRQDPKTAVGCDALLLGVLAIKWGFDKFRGRYDRPWNPPGQSPPPASPVTAGPRVPAGIAGGAAKMLE